MLRKCLLVGVRSPKPNGKGDQIIFYHRILQFIKMNETVTIAYISSSDDDVDCLERLRSLGVNILVCNRSKIEALLSIIKNFIFFTTPLQVAYFENRNLKTIINQWMAAHNPDIVHLITSRAYINLKSYNAPISTDHIDSLSLNFKRRLNNSKLLNLLFNFEFNRLRKYEAFVASISIFNSIVSKTDRSSFPFNIDFTVIPIPIYVENNDLFDKSSNSCSLDLIKDLSIVFSGNMSYHPNIEAVLWFVENCWYELCSEFQGIKLHIVGRDPSKKIQKLNGKNNIIVTGYVRSVPEYIRQCTLAIAPMLSGTGMQFKILESLISGLPIVVTPLGMGDISIEIEDNIWIANNKNEFLASIRNIIYNRNALYDKSMSRRDRVIELYSYDKVGNQFIDSIYSAYNSYYGYD